MMLTNIELIYFCFVFALRCRKPSQRKVLNQVIQRFAIPTRKGSEADADARISRIRVADVAICLKKPWLLDPYSDCGANRQTCATQEQTAGAQIIRGILDADRFAADLQLYGPVEQHPGERPGV
jgi:hypothetical protein